MGLGSCQGVEARCEFWGEWMDAHAEFEMAVEEVVDLGNGVTLAVIFQMGRPVGSSGYVQIRFAMVGVWVDGAAVRTINYDDIDKARAAAERLAESRE